MTVIVKVEMDREVLADRETQGANGASVESTMTLKGGPALGRSHPDPVREGLEQVKAQVLRLEDLMAAALQAVPGPPLADAGPVVPAFIGDETALLAKRELQLLVLLDRYLGLMKDQYGDVRRDASNYLRSQGVSYQWAENNGLFIELLGEYASRWRAMSPAERRMNLDLENKSDLPPIQVAKRLAAQVHEGMTYGEGPFTNHTDAVADLLNFYFPNDVNLISAGHLHDAVEDAPDESSGDKIRNLIMDQCGDDVLDLVLAVTDEPGANRPERKLKTYPKICRAGWRAVALKVSDRIVNMLASACDEFPYRAPMYAKEYKDFRLYLRGVGLGIQPLQQMWSRLDEIMIAAGAKIDPSDRVL
jgi:guanosine-3',5'-bis(diphosphate) 3'-pyrophosphohydrolase